MQKICLKWRPIKFDNPVNYGSFSLNGGYTLAFRYNNSRLDYVEKCGVNILDTILEPKLLDIGNDGSDRMGKYFAIVEFDETKISADSLAFDLTHDYPDYGVRVLSNDESVAFLRNFTTCEENDKLFTIREESIDPITQTVTPAYFLNLN